MGNCFRMDKLKQLHVCVPLYGYVPAQSMLSFMKLFGYAPKYFERIAFHAIDGAYVHLTRRKIAASVLREPLQDQDYMLWIDQDMVFEENDFKRLVESAVANPNDIVAGYYVSKHAAPKAVAFLKTGQGFEPLKAVPENQLIQVDSTGMGFMIVPTSALHSMVREHGLESVVNLKDRQTGIEMGEDFLFCTLAKRKGHDVLLHTGIALGHAGAIAFPR